jgi:hypothetical protein
MRFPRLFPRSRWNVLFLVLWAFLSGFSFAEAAFLSALYGPSGLGDVFGIWIVGTIALLIVLGWRVAEPAPAPPEGAC